MFWYAATSYTGKTHKQPCGDSCISQHEMSLDMHADTSYTTHTLNISLQLHNQYRRVLELGTKNG